MKQIKELTNIFICLAFLMFHAGLFPGFVSAALKKTTQAVNGPVTASEWAAKIGLDWGPKYWLTKPVRGGTYRTAAPVYIGLMNPNHWPVNDWTIMSYLYNTLVMSDSSYRPKVPWLAESWEFPDDRTCIMKLRRGVQFHDGSMFNAESLKYQIEWIIDPQNGAWTRSWLEPVSSIEVIDAYTVKWHFKRPWAAFLSILSNPPGYVISAKALKADAALRDFKKVARRMDKEKKNAEEAEKEAASATGEAAEKMKEKAQKARTALATLDVQYAKLTILAEGAKPLDTNPVGSGAYMLEEANPGNYVILKRNPNWWFAKWSGMDMPYFDRMKINVIPDPAIRIASLRAQTLDSMFVEPSQYPMIKSDRSLQVYVAPRNSLVSMAFNHKQGPCKDIRIRKAISHALDRKALINAVAFGLGRPASCLMPDDHWAHNPSLKPVSYDPALSRKLLVGAGYKDGLSIKGFVGNSTPSMTMAEAIKAMLAKVGIVWNVQIIDAAGAMEKIRNVDYDFCEAGWAVVNDPDLMVTGWYHPEGGFNYGRVHNEAVIALIEEGRKEMNEQKRTKIYWDMEKLLYDNFEDCWLWHPIGVSVFGRKVQGWNNDMYKKMGGPHWSTHPLWFKGGHQ